MPIPGVGSAAQRGKPPTAVPAFHIGVPVCLQAALLPLQLSPNVPGRAAGGGPSTWSPAVCPWLHLKSVPDFLTVTANLF